MNDEKNFLICHGKKFFYTCMMIMISAVIGVDGGIYASDYRKYV